MKKLVIQVQAKELPALYMKLNTLDYLDLEDWKIQISKCYEWELGGRWVLARRH